MPEDPAPDGHRSQALMEPFDRLFMAEYGKVVAVANRVLADRTEAEDVAQEVFFEFHRKHRPDASYAPAWLHRAAVHTSLNRIRGRKRRERRELTEAQNRDHEVVDPQQVVEIKEDRRQVRVALSRLGNLYARFMLGIAIHDATSGYRVYRRDLLQRLLQTPFATDGYGFQIELVMRADRLGYAVGEAPITFREREHGVSKISRSIVVEALWSVTRWGFAMRLGRHPSY